MVKFWVRDASHANDSSLPTWHTSFMPAWGKMSDRKQETGREPVFPAKSGKKNPIKTKKQKNGGERLDPTKSPEQMTALISPTTFKPGVFKGVLTVLEDDPPNFNQHLLYSKSFENSAFHSPASAQSFLAVLKHTVSISWQHPCYKLHAPGAHLYANHPPALALNSITPNFSAAGISQLCIFSLTQPTRQRFPFSPQNLRLFQPGARSNICFSLGQATGALQPEMWKHSHSGGNVQHSFLLRMTSG